MGWRSKTIPAMAVAATAAVAVRDLLQRDHALQRNFPLLGHARYLLEAIGPELRQYRAIPPSSPNAGHEVDLPCAKVMGAARQRKAAFRPSSLVNISAIRRDLVKVAEACGVEHPGLIDADSVEILDGRTASTSLRDVYHYLPGWGLPSAEDRRTIIELMTATMKQGASAPSSASATGAPSPAQG